MYIVGKLKKKQKTKKLLFCCELFYIAVLLSLQYVVKRRADATRAPVQLSETCFRYPRCHTVLMSRVSSDLCFSVFFLHNLRLVFCYFISENVCFTCFHVQASVLCLTTMIFFWLSHNYYYPCLVVSPAHMSMLHIGQFQVVPCMHYANNCAICSMRGIPSWCGTSEKTSSVQLTSLHPVSHESMDHNSRCQPQWSCA